MDDLVCRARIVVGEWPGAAVSVRRIAIAYHGLLAAIDQAATAGDAGASASVV